MLEKEIQEAIKILGQGGVIAFPTDTVYGLGGDAFTDTAVERIYRIKERDREKPFVLFIPEKNELKKYVEGLSRDAQKLVNAFWPGPLTLVFRASHHIPPRLNSKGTVGIRIPKDEIVLSLLKTYGKPLATTSANRSGELQCRSGEEVKKKFGKEIGYVLEGGRLDHENSSTVLDISQSPPLLLRKGKISVSSIEKVLKYPVAFGKGLTFNILFLCTGNACRSPMALGLFRNRLPERLRKRVISTSCGTGALENEPATEDAVQAARELGVDLSSHRSQSLSKFLIEYADLILVMAPHHKERVLELSQGALEKTHLLRGYGKRLPLEKRIIEDPIGRPLDFYRMTIQIIEESIRPVIEELKERFDPS